MNRKGTIRGVRPQDPVMSPGAELVSIPYPRRAFGVALFGVGFNKDASDGRHHTRYYPGLTRPKIRRSHQALPRRGTIRLEIDVDVIGKALYPRDGCRSTGHKTLTPIGGIDHNRKALGRNLRPESEPTTLPSPEKNHCHDGENKRDKDSGKQRSFIHGVLCLPSSSRKILPLSMRSEDG